jgi:hypothetical protein
VFAIAVALFALSTFLLPVGQSVMSALLFVATAVIAWSGSRTMARPREEAAAAS